MNTRRNALLLILLTLAWVTVLVLANLAVDPVAAEPGQLTATYGADQWHAQLTAIYQATAWPELQATLYGAHYP